VEFSRRFGELDDIRPYLHPGRKLRYEYVELFDAGNVGDDGRLLGVEEPRWWYNKVCNSSSLTLGRKGLMGIGKLAFPCGFVV
jgi:hypothetical protein